MKKINIDVPQFSFQRKKIKRRTIRMATSLNKKDNGTSKPITKSQLVFEKRRKSMEVIINIWKQFLFSNRQERFMRLNSPTFRKKKVEFEHKRLEEKREKERKELIEKRRIDLMRKNKKSPKLQRRRIRIRKSRKDKNEKELLVEAIHDKKFSNMNKKPSKKSDDSDSSDNEDENKKGLRRYFSKQINEQTLK